MQNFEVPTRYKLPLGRTWFPWCSETDQALSFGRAFEDAIFESFSSNFTAALARPLGSQKSNTRDKTVANFRAQHETPNRPLTAFESLSVEIIWQIFQHCHISDVFHVGLVSYFLLDVAERFYWSRKCRLFGQWTNKEIFCFYRGNDWALNSSSHSPLCQLEGSTVLFNAARRHGWPDFWPTHFFQAIDSTNTSLRPPWKLDLGHLSSRRFAMLVRRHPELFTVFGYKNKSVLDHPLQGDERLKILLWTRAIRARLADNFTPGSPWILRNLTTQEFVRADAIALHPDLVHGPFIEGIGFSHVILSHCCWLRLWAHHSFDIVLEDEVAADLSVWTDVSDDAAISIDFLWTSKFGKDWKTKMIRTLKDSRARNVKWKGFAERVWEKDAVGDLTIPGTGFRHLIGAIADFILFLYEVVLVYASVLYKMVRPVLHFVIIGSIIGWVARVKCL